MIELNNGKCSWKLEMVKNKPWESERDRQETKGSNESKGNEREMGRRRCSDGTLVDEMENGDK